MKFHAEQSEKKKNFSLIYRKNDNSFDIEPLLQKRMIKNLTQVAHSFSKHAGRHPEIWGKLKGSMSEWHDEALKQLQQIYIAPGEFTKVVDLKTGMTWIEKKLPDGRGIRLNQDYTFKGFVD